jgi:hypothetical protein
MRRPRAAGRRAVTSYPLDTGRSGSLRAMGASPMPRNNSSGPVPPEDVYRVAVEEYRFQATYNWTRTQYLLSLNVAVLVAAAAVASQDEGRGAGLIFLFGIAAAVLSSQVVRQQHDYYRAARDRMRRAEADLAVPASLRMDTTSTLGGRKRALSVNQLVYLLLGALAVSDVVGALLMLAR